MDLGRHRPLLLRHCYRMLGSFADAEDVVQDALERALRARKSYRGDAPLDHWLLRIATNRCLNLLKRRRHLHLPQDEAPAAGVGDEIERLGETRWLTPAPDARLFRDPEEAIEKREGVALAFIALLQHLPPRQRAVLLLRDVGGWPASEVAEALDLSVGAVNSALHRARQAIPPPGEIPASEEPGRETLRAYLRAWEEHDVNSLVALLRKDVVFAMPPYATWYRGARDVARFLRTPRFAAFWATGLRLRPTRANGCPAVAFYLKLGKAYLLHSVQVLRFAGGRIAESTVFIGPHYLRGFALPPRTVSRASVV
jgi:RNA polymerase sigma-70 factor (ECF subfamily)